RPLRPPFLVRGLLVLALDPDRGEDRLALLQALFREEPLHGLEVAPEALVGGLQAGVAADEAAFPDDEIGHEVLPRQARHDDLVVRAVARLEGVDAHERAAQYREATKDRDPQTLHGRSGPTSSRGGRRGATCATLGAHGEARPGPP